MYKIHSIMPVFLLKEPLDEVNFDDKNLTTRYPQNVPLLNWHVPSTARCLQI